MQHKMPSLQYLGGLWVKHTGGGGHCRRRSIQNVKGPSLLRKYPGNLCFLPSRRHREGSTTSKSSQLPFSKMEDNIEWQPSEASQINWSFEHSDLVPPSTRFHAQCSAICTFFPRQPHKPDPTRCLQPPKCPFMAEIQIIQNLHTHNNTHPSSI